MAHSRLTLAIDAGHVVLPEDGTIGVFGPSADVDLSALPLDRVQIIQGFKPDFDFWEERGYRALTSPQGPFSLAIVFLPRAKDAMRARVAMACECTEGLVVLDGLKTDGIDSLYKELRKRAPVSAAFSKAHGKTFSLAANADLSNWKAPETPREVAPGFVTIPGVFSAQGIDKGSAVLAEALPAKLPANLADLGSGWGWLSAQILGRDGVASLDMIEADHAAYSCAKQNAKDPRAKHHWQDVTRFSPAKLYDGIITNPPFHTSRNADPAIGRAFLSAGAKMLHPGGHLWAVANRHLPYEVILSELFLEVSEIAGTPSFKVLHARRPRRSK